MPRRVLGHGLRAATMIAMLVLIAADFDGSDEPGIGAARWAPTCCRESIGRRVRLDRLEARRHARSTPAIHCRAAFPHLKFESPVVLVGARGTGGSFSVTCAAGSTHFPMIPTARRPILRSNSPKFIPT